MNTIRLVLFFCLSASSAYAIEFGDIPATTDVSTLWQGPFVADSPLSLSAGHLSIDVSSIVNDTAYDATTWNGDATHAPSKNAVRDKIESLAATIPTISDTAFGSSWNGATTIAPSKNAVYDWAHIFDTDDDGKVNVLDIGAGIPKTDAGGVVSLATLGTDYLDSSYIDDTAYDATTWNGDTTHAPSKNAVRDKFESLIGTIPGISDTAFAASWDADTTHAASKNAIYDWAHTFDTDDDGLPNKVDLSTAGAVTTDSSGVLSALAPGTSGNVATSNGSVWTSAAPVSGSYWDATHQVSGSNFTSSSATLVDITGLSHAASASSLYEIEVVLRVQNSGTNAIQFAGAYSAAGATGDFLFDASNGNTTRTSSVAILGVAEAQFYYQVATTDYILHMRGIVITGANTGNITVQTLHNTSGTTTVYIGSIMKVKKLQ